ncbi:hypothetical protein LTR37_010813 [Vermiconidia calcicola]|uniref:Uncharacterized protein n=1 Tax=Vermiconidia calcicola TaxID=1690605 RepID=A0ACC3N3Z3_9PEZI|nr:hypothetical protein LTR37_010813 [Vermiconidia calcicola]
MASSHHSQENLGKRKRADDVKDEEEDRTLFIDDGSDEHLEPPGAKQDDDSDDDDATYDECSEDFPRCAAYHPRFLEICDRLKNMAKEAQGVLRTQTCRSKDVQDLRSRVEEVLDIPEPDRPMIGLLGDTGSGKSSLVNSLTDIPDLAGALDGGESCTYVVTLYQKALPSQGCDFSATIEYFDLPTVGKLLANCLDDWFLYYFEFDEGWTNEARQQYYRRARTCLLTFMAIFCGTNDFQTENMAAERLNRLVKKGYDREKEVGLYVNAAAKVLAPKKQDDGKYRDYLEAEDQEELRELTDPLLTESSSPEEVTLWPFVKKVNVGVRGSRILDRFTVADLPGISDTNQVRVNATYEHIDICDEIWIIGRAGRVITDNVVDGLLQRYAMINRGHVAVIATKTDENLSHQLALNMRKKGYSLGDYQQLKKASTVMGKQLKGMQTEKRKLSSKKADEKLELQEEIDSQFESQQRLESQCLGLIAQARNNHITASLQEAKQEHLPKGVTLDVFCVSNQHYAAHKNATKVSGPTLSVGMTQIPELRKFALRLAAPKILRSLEDFTKHDFSVFIKGLDLWASSELVEGRSELLSIVRSPQQSVSRNFDEYLKMVEAFVEGELVNPILKDLDIHISCAVAAQDSIKQWHHSTLRAFMKNYGKHKTTAMPEQSWNESFTATARKVIMAVREDLDEKQTALNEKLQKVVVNSVNDMMKKLHGQPAAVGLPMQIFEGAVAAQLRGIHNKFRNHNESLLDDFKAIFHNATQDREGSYFRSAMLQCYDQCIQDGGSGVQGRWMAAFRMHLTLAGDRSPFALLAKSAHKAIIRTTKARTKTVQAGVLRILRTVVQQFETMISQKNDDQTEIPVRRAIKEFLVEANPRFEEIKTDLKALKEA